jgi:hypothetical protein
MDMNNDNDEFFGDGESQAEEAPSKLRIGDEEFDPEEAQKLIALGKMGREVEEKYNTRLDRVYPEYTKATQELASIRKEREEAERQALQQKQDQGSELTPEERKRLAREQARELGILTEDSYSERFDRDYAERRAGEKLVDTVNDLVKDASDKGIKTTNVQILEFMQQEGLKNPKTAFELMHKDAIRSWEAEELRKSRPNGIVTESSSTAGAKSPEPVKYTRTNLLDSVLESLNNGSK